MALPRWLMSPPYLRDVCAQYRPYTMTNWKANRRSGKHRPRAQDSRQSAKLHPTQFSDALRAIVQVVERWAQDI